MKIIKIGDKQGKLKIVKKVGKKSFMCVCDCGKFITEYQSRLYNRISCGCMTGKHSIKHGKSGTPFYKIWKGLNSRCYVKSNTAYQTYGKLGIKSDWKDDFKKFEIEMYKSYLEHVKIYGRKKTTIDRIDINGNYCKENCRWATPTEQCRNRSVSKKITIDEVTKSVIEWCIEFDIEYQTMLRRIQNGWKGRDLLIRAVVGRNQTFKHE